MNMTPTPSPGCVVITGATAGIGRATAIAFARRGWHVGLLARGIDGLEGARRDVEDAGGVALMVPTDVADPAQVEAAADRIEREIGPIDVWVNNAMATVYCEVDKISPEDFQRTTQVTFLGSVWGTQAALKRMKLRNRGRIVQVGSALAYRSIPLQAPYCAAKSAIRGFIDSLRCELLHQKSDIHLTMVQLSAFNTPQFDWGKTCLDKQPQPVPPIYQPEVAAEAIFWASQHKRRELWVGLPAVTAILSARVAPGLGDRLIARNGYASQHTNQALPPGRRDNLHQPVPGDHGAHGRFDTRAHADSFQLWANMHRYVALAMLALPVGLWWATRTRRQTAIQARKR